MILRNISKIFCFLLACTSAFAQTYEYNDVHFHLTNYVQKGADLHDIINIMNHAHVGQMAVFGIPLQQKWNMRLNQVEDKPEYYLHTGEKLYYYSAVDPMIAREYLELTPDEQNRFYPMITGFNPTDGYAVDHIKNMLIMYPGVFTGIGEFTINKEVVSSKISGAHATLANPALGAILNFATKVGMVILIHSDIDTIRSNLNNTETAVYLDDMDRLFSRHKDSTIIWAHTGLGRFVRPKPHHLKSIEKLLVKYPNLYFDISWQEIAKYIVKNEKTIANWSALINKYPERFIFGTDTVAPNLASYRVALDSYKKLWPALSPEAQKLVKHDNFTRIFSAAEKKVRAWERQNVPNLVPTINWPFADDSEQSAADPD